MSAWQEMEKEEIKADEGLRLTAYPDPLTKAEPYTIGYGHTGKDVKPGLVITKEQADELFETDFEEAVTEAAQAVPFFSALDGARKGALVNLAFNLGGKKLAEFHGTLAALDSGDYTSAALHLMNSRYARQVRGRAVRLAYRLRTGEYALRT